MIVVGVVGGVAGGKSLVARQLAELGAEVLDADRVGHEVLGEPEVKEALRSRWGEQIFDERGAVDRRRVAGIVFAGGPRGAEELVFLEQVTHPRIDQRLRARLAAARRRSSGVLVLDAAVLFKAGWEQMCDRILFVDAPRPMRLARALGRGWSAADLAAREAAQPPLDEMRRQAEMVIDNSGSAEQTFEQIQRFWNSLWTV